MKSGLKRTSNPTFENDFEKKIFELLSKNLMSTSQVAKRLGMRRDVAAGYLQALKNQGKLEFHKVGGSHVYIVPERLRK